MTTRRVLSQEAADAYARLLGAFQDAQRAGVFAESRNGTKLENAVRDASEGPLAIDTWSAEDLKQVFDDHALTDEEAATVLRRSEYELDVEEGLSWDAMNCRVLDVVAARQPEPAPKPLELSDIVAAVDAGKSVHWSSDNYTVIKDKFGRYLIKHDGGNCIGLTWADGKTLNGRPEDFYIKEN